MREERGGGSAAWQALLLSPVLATCVTTLVVNDHVLKERWPGLLTGKLSDVAGVAMIAIVLAGISGRPRAAVVVVAAGFTLLKTVDPVAELAAPALGGVTLTDPTDLVALFVLVPLWRWLRRWPARREPRHEPAWTEALKAVSLGAVVLATSATSCADDEVRSVRTVGTSTVVAVTSDGDFESRDGGRTWRRREGADDGDGSLGVHRRCFDDGRCFEVAGALLTMSTPDSSTVDFELSTEEWEALVESNPNNCGSAVALGPVTTVELTDGGHVVVGAGPHGALHRSPDGSWAWVRIGEYGRGNPLAPFGEASPVAAGPVLPFGWSLALVIPIALALSAIPLARLARRHGRRAFGAVLPPVLSGALVLLLGAPVVILAGGWGNRAAEIGGLVVMAAIAVTVVGITAAALVRSRPPAGPPAPWSPPSPSRPPPEPSWPMPARTHSLASADPGDGSTAALLRPLAGRTADELVQLETQLGGILHRHLVEMAAGGFGGLVLSCGACPGLGDAFASYDGSSDYLRGDLTPIGHQAIGALTAGEFRVAGFGESYAGSLLAGVRAFLREHRLPGQLVVLVVASSSLGGPAGVRIVLAGEDSTLVDSVELPVAADGARPGADVRRRLAAVAALIALGRWIERTHGDDVTPELVDCLTAGASGRRTDGRTERVAELAAANRQAWDDVGRRLAPGTLLSIGESFTFGRLARLCGSGADASGVVDLLYGWYDPRFKVALGVPEEQTADELIAEPRTVELGARGLLDRAPGAPTLAVATSGWANNAWLADRDGERRDFFSVAVLGRGHAADGRVGGETIRCSVTGTAGEPPSPARRQLTRELGVTAALVLLLRRVGAHDEAGELTSSLRRWATVELRAV